MTLGERPFKEKLALQIAICKIDGLFEKCSKFEEMDKVATQARIARSPTTRSYLHLRRVRGSV
jgi:hypothetical protein